MDFVIHRSLGDEEERSHLEPNLWCSTSIGKSLALTFSMRMPGQFASVPSWAAGHGGKTASVIGIKVWRDRVFLTLPQWHGNSHPLNLAVVSLPPGGARLPHPASPTLRPFPSWGAGGLWGHTVCTEHGGGAGGGGVMWLPDNGRQLRSSIKAVCRAKLVLLGLPGGRVLHTHTFPRAVVPDTGSFLNNLAINEADRGDRN